MLLVLQFYAEHLYHKNNLFVISTDILNPAFCSKKLFFAVISQEEILWNLQTTFSKPIQ